MSWTRAEAALHVLETIVALHDTWLRDGEQAA